MIPLPALLAVTAALLAVAIRIWAPDLGDRPVMGIVCCWLVGHGEIVAVEQSGIRLGGFRCAGCGKAGASYGDFGIESGYVRGGGRR